MPSNDFEALPIGSAAELRLSRALVTVIEQQQARYPGTIPDVVVRAYAPLKAHLQQPGAGS